MVAQAGTLGEARRLLAEQDLDVAILDLHLPDGDGTDLIGKIREATPHAWVLVLSMFPKEDEGADGALGKNAVFDEVVGTVRSFGNR